MGIPGFFKWLTNKDYYPDIVKDCVKNGPNTVDETLPNPNGIEVDYPFLFLFYSTSFSSSSIIFT